MEASQGGASPTVSRFATETPSLNSLLAARTLRVSRTAVAAAAAAASITSRQQQDDNDRGDYDGMPDLVAIQPPSLRSFTRTTTTTRTTSTIPWGGLGVPTITRTSSSTVRRAGHPQRPLTSTTFHFYRPALTAATATAPSSQPPAAAAAARAPRRSSRVASQRSSAAACSSTSFSSVPFTATTRSTAAAAASVRPSSSSSRKRKSRDSETPPAKRARRSSCIIPKPPPNAKNDADYEDNDVEEEDDDRKPSASSSDGEAVCCVCMCEPSKEEASNISGCEHIFCFGCISKWADRENTCPLCKVRFTKITRVNKVVVRNNGKRKGAPVVQNVKTVKNCDQRSDLVSGSALEAMLNSIAAANGSGTRIGHFLAVMNGGVPPRAMIGGSPAGARSSRTFALRPSGSHLHNDDSDDDEDSDSFPTDFGAFMRAAIRTSYAQARGSHAASVAAPAAHRSASNFAATSLPGAFMAAVAAAGPSPPARSFATNGNDQSAGRARENPLTIDDSDDDDEVEVLRTVAHRRRRRLP